MSSSSQKWAKATLGELTSKLVDGSHNPPPKAETGLPMLSARNIMDGKINYDAYRFIDPDAFEIENRRTDVSAGDVLLTIVGTIGRTAVVPDDYKLFTLQRSVAVFTPAEGIDSQYLSYFLASTETQKWFEENAKGTAQKGVYLKALAKLDVPVAPLPEQLRIVAKVYGLNARTARARKELDRIPTLIARYKSAILALAFKGDLTKDWREQLGREQKSDRKLPSDWKIEPLGEVSEIQGGIQVGKKRPSTAVLVEVPYLRVANVQRGWLNLQEMKTLGVTAQERDRLLLQDGDVLMNEGGDRDKLGRGWVWHGEVPVCIHQNHVFRIRLTDKTFPPEFVSHYANENGQQYFIDQGTQTTNLASISKKKVSALPVPMPPTDEADEIVRRIDTAFGWLDRVAADHSAAARLLPKLDAAILATAFRGELVLQDPNDEPASVLLERIAAERAIQPKKKRGQKAKGSVPKKDMKTMTKNLEQVLAEAGDWIAAQDAFQRCGIGDKATTQEIEKFYAELRVLDKEGRLEAEPVNDDQGRKLHDRLRLKAA